MNQSPPMFSISDNWPQVRAISFDLDNTLWPIEPVIEHAERQLWNWLCQHHPRITEHYDIPRMRQHRIDTAAAFPALSHDISGLRRRSLERLLVEFGYADDPAHAQISAEAGWRIFYEARHQIDWFDDARPALQRLQAHYPLAATTNGNANVELLGIAEHFTAVLRAGEVGHAKPDAPMWQALTDALQLQPEQILHIGDSPEDDVLGAMRHGFPAVWLNRDAAAWPVSEQPSASIVSLDQLIP